MLDGDELLLPRSSSLSGIETYSTQRMIITEFNEEQAIAELNANDAGAARLRDMPLRKTRTTRATTATGPTTSAAAVKRTTRGASKTKLHDIASGDGGIRGRRKLREATPDVDVEGD